MNKFSLYILLILIFLGLSQTFSLTEKGSPFIRNKQVLGNFFEGSPICVILIDAFQTGFLIKTYYHKYKIIYGFRPPRILTSRTSYEFFKENKNNVGLSIFRREEQAKSENSVPMPPGILFIGNPAYGSWINIDSGERIWLFHRVYRHFSRLLGWGNFRPNYEFYKKARIHLQQERSFYGLNGEFGTNGKLTKENFPEYFQKSEKEEISFREFFMKQIRPKIFGKANE